MTKEERREYDRKRYQANRAKILEYHKKYDAEHKSEKAEYKKQYNAEHKQEITEYMEQYRKQYSNTPMGRAINLRNGHIQKDREHGRIGDELPSDYVTSKWIVENIFTKPCTHCGITGWEVIGCNRLDNSKPHTKDNVEPCCALCNSRLPRQ